VFGSQVVECDVKEASELQAAAAANVRITTPTESAVACRIGSLSAKRKAQ